MSNITLYNNGTSQMTVMALGSAINWNPKTTLVVTEKEAEILLKYPHIINAEDVPSNKDAVIEKLQARIAELEKELSDLKSSPVEEDREALKAKAKELGIEFAKNIKTEELAKLIKDSEGK